MDTILRYDEGTIVIPHITSIEVSEMHSFIKVHFTGGNYLTIHTNNKTDKLNIKAAIESAINQWHTTILTL